MVRWPVSQAVERGVGDRGGYRGSRRVSRIEGGRIEESIEVSVES